LVRRGLRRSRLVTLLHTCTHACACVRTYTCAHTYTRTHMYSHTHAHMRAHTLTHVHTHTHTHTHHHTKTYSLARIDTTIFTPIGSTQTMVTYARAKKRSRMWQHHGHTKRAILLNWSSNSRMVKIKGF